ncbi:hypothetical protein BC629DRAFT_188910 [Irpex lacteus]|nr:hypothetical protein BC629DRAFT_188910 [Irpex lacteus]
MFCIRFFHNLCGPALAVSKDLTWPKRITTACSKLYMLPQQYKAVSNGHCISPNYLCNCIVDSLARSVRGIGSKSMTKQLGFEVVNASLVWPICSEGMACIVR